MSRLANSGPKNLITALKTECSEVIQQEDVDWKAVRKRIRMAAIDAGLSYEDVAAFLGLDMADPDYAFRVSRLPKLRTAIRVADFIGVPMKWVLSGEGSYPLHQKKEGAVHRTYQGISNTTESTVVQGNTAGTIVINSSQQASKQKEELWRIFDALPLREQTKLLNFAFDLEASRYNKI